MRSTRLFVVSPARLMRRIEAVTIWVPLAATHRASACGGIAGGAQKQARPELAAGDDERIGHFLHFLADMEQLRIRSPPWRARQISTLSPGLSGVCGQAARGTTAPLTRDRDPALGDIDAFSSSSAASVRRPAARPRR